MTTVTTRTVRYPADGLTMIGHLALPAGAGPRPAVLIGPEGSGLNDFQRRRADALAELGYVALLAECLPVTE
jgi:dienelactone hydrolase